MIGDQADQPGETLTAGEAAEHPFSLRRRTGGIIACSECPSSLNLPDGCGGRRRGLVLPTRASAVIAPARRSTGTCVRSRKRHLAQRHLGETTDSAASVGGAGRFRYQDTEQKPSALACSQDDKAA